MGLRAPSLGRWQKSSGTSSPTQLSADALGCDLAVTPPCLRRCELSLQKEQAALPRMTTLNLVAALNLSDLPFHSGAMPSEDVWGER